MFCTLQINTYIVGEKGNEERKGSNEKGESHNNGSLPKYDLTLEQHK